MSDNRQSIAPSSSESLPPGALLSAYRKKLNMPEAEAADHLKISAKRLKAIEADDYSDFPSPTYVRGHLRNYARLVNITDSQIIDIYDAYFSEGASTAGSMTEEPVKDDEGVQKHWWFVYLILVLIVALWVISYGLLGDGEAQDLSVTEPDESPVAVSEPVPPIDLAEAVPTSSSLAATIIPAAEAANEVADDASVSTVDPILGEGDEPIDQPPAQELIVSKMTAAELVSTVIAPEQELEQAEEPAPAPVVEPVGDQLVFTFSNECWVEVSDKNGVLVASLQKPNTELTLSGEAPFRVIVGNTEGTSLQFNGKPIELIPESGRKFARLRVEG